MRYRLNELTGKVFGRLTVIRRVPSPNPTKHRSAYWLCRCACGKEVVVRSDALTSKRRATKSCGCLTGERATEISSLPRGVAAFNILFQQYQRNAKMRKLEFTLTEDEFKGLVLATCKYCGVEPRQIIGSLKNTGKFIYNGVDRVDNLKGYTLENSVACCGTCNIAKHALSIEEWESWVKRLVMKYLQENKEYAK